MPASTRLLPLLCGLALALAHAGPRAAAHGGVYRGPGATVPPGPAPAAPTTPAGGTTGTPGSPTGDLTSWRVWWAYRRDPFLDLRAAVHADGAATRGGGFSLGRGERAQGRGLMRPGESDLRERVVPALLVALDSQASRDVRSACLIALARIGADVAGCDLRTPIASLLADSDQEVAETAALALGLLGDDRAAPLLAQLMADDEPGRRLVGERAVPARTRAFAAYGLGLAAEASRREDVRRFAVSRLAAALEHERFAARDVPVACVSALGLIPLQEWGTGESHGDLVEPASASRGALVRFLLRLLADEQRDALVRAQIPGAVARLLIGAETLPGGRALKQEAGRALLAPLAAHSGARVELRQACAIALGLLGDGDQDELDVAIREALARRAAEGEFLEGSLALVSLAEVAVRVGAGPYPLAALAQVRGRLHGRLARGTSLSRPWAGLALALLERGAALHGRGPSSDSTLALRSALEAAASPEESAAHALALGLLRDPLAVDPLLERMADLAADDLRGHVAIALGLSGSPRCISPLRQVLESSRYRPQLLRDTAVALALVGDKGAVPVLVEALREAGSLSAQAALASALGTIGDARALGPLLELLADEQVTARARAFAAAALGRVGDRRSLPWNVSLARTAVWTGAPETLSDPASGSGVLDLF